LEEQEQQRSRCSVCAACRRSFFLALRHGPFVNHSHIHIFIHCSNPLCIVRMPMFMLLITTIIASGARITTAPVASLHTVTWSVPSSPCSCEPCSSQLAFEGCLKPSFCNALHCHDHLVEAEIFLEDTGFT